MIFRNSRFVVALLVVLLVAGAPALQAAGHGSRGTARSSVSSQNVNRNANVNRNTNVNRNVNRNTNIDIDRDIDIDVDHHHGCCYHRDYHPVAAVAAVAVTAAIVGSIIYSLPPACTVVYVNGFTYQDCGTVWYQPQFVGTTTTYVVVVAPQ